MVGTYSERERDRHERGDGAERDSAALAASLIQVMGSRAAFETCMSSQWFDVAEEIYRLSTGTSKVHE